MRDGEKQQQGESVEAESRRTFIKSLVAAIGGISTLSTMGSAAALHPSLPQSVAEVPAVELPWRRTIFCQFDGEGKHKELLEALRKCAREIDCKIVHGTNGDPDIFAYGCFIQIVDRNSVGEEMWRDYAAAYKNAGDITPCFIIDDRKDLPLPE